MLVPLVSVELWGVDGVNNTLQWCHHVWRKATLPDVKLAKMGSSF